MKKLKLKNSERLYKEGRKHLVGGVNSPVRSFGAVGGTPRFIEKAKGAMMTDVDGHAYIDYVGSWGPMILGHGHETVMKSVKKNLERGTSFGAPSENEVELAALIKQAIPSIEQIRFTNSGTEATMSAIRLAKAVTKRDRILKFEGGYHGHSDGLLVAAGSGATTFGTPSSAGVSESLARNTWVLPYNDSFAVDDLFRTQGINIAAVIVEPVAGNMGVVPPAKGFLKRLRNLCSHYGSILIFDEVMTGFRLGWGGAQSLYLVKPDLTCLGKIIGGGFPVGAFGGSKHYMENLAPLGPVYQAGTLSGNPIAMAAGLATLKYLKAKKPYSVLKRNTQTLVQALKAAAKKFKIQVQVNQVESMFTVFFAEDPVTSYLMAQQADTKKYAAFFHSLLDNNVYFPPSQFEAAFVSTAHTKSILDQTRVAFEKSFKVLSSHL